MVPGFEQGLCSWARFLLSHPLALCCLPRPAEGGGEGAGEAERERTVEVAPALQGEQKAPKRPQVMAPSWQLPSPFECGVPSAWGRGESGASARVLASHEIKYEDFLFA